MNNKSPGDRRVLIHVASPMAGRIVFDSNLLDHLKRSGALRVTVCTPDPRVRELFHDQDDDVQWAPFDLSAPAGGWIQRAFRLLTRHLHLMVVYRFNRLSNFQGSRLSLKMSNPTRRRAQKSGLATSRWLGFPFPKSRRIFNLLYRLLYLRRSKDERVEELFLQLDPDVLVLTHLQMGAVAPVVRSAIARDLPVVGMVGSWDQLTTYGPLVPGVNRFIAHNKHIRDNLVSYHSIAAEDIEVIGWPQLDPYSTADLGNRSELMESLGFDPDDKLVVFGANAGWLGRHEGPVAIQLGRRAEASCYGPDFKMLIRCHPYDPASEAAFRPLAGSSHVRIELADLRDLAYLAKLMRHADVVISTGGSILLDAVAMDTPAIALAFAEGDVRHFDDPARLYEWEHNASVIASGGVWIARTFAELEEALLRYLEEPSLHAGGRARLRASHLEPLDGQASKRFADAILTAAG